MTSNEAGRSFTTKVNDFTVIWMERIVHYLYNIIHKLIKNPVFLDFALLNKFVKLYAQAVCLVDANVNSLQAIFVNVTLTHRFPFRRRSANKLLINHLHLNLIPIRNGLNLSHYYDQNHRCLVDRHYHCSNEMV